MEIWFGEQNNNKNYELLAFPQVSHENQCIYERERISSGCHLKWEKYEINVRKVMTKCPTHICCATSFYSEAKLPLK